MTVYDLNRDQLIELKQQYYQEKTGSPLSYVELSIIDDLVSDEEIYDAYNGTRFVPDDFFGSSGQDEEENIRFFVADVGRNEAFYLHAINGIQYEWSDWAASTFSKRGAQDALAWCKKNGYKNSRVIAIMD